MQRRFGRPKWGQNVGGPTMLWAPLDFKSGGVPGPAGRPAPTPMIEILRHPEGPKLAFVGHVPRSDREFGQMLLLGMVLGKRGRGRPKARFSDGLKESCGLNLIKIARLAPRMRQTGKECVGGQDCRKSSHPNLTMTEFVCG